MDSSGHPFNTQNHLQSYPEARIDSQGQVVTHHPSPKQQTPLSDTELRERIVETLSNTANGCLNELGYYPGIAQKLKQLEITNKTWQVENVKLYEDNRRLLNTIREQHERLKLISIPELEKIDRIRRLELEVQGLRQSALSSNNQEEGLQREFIRLKEAYRIAYNEVRRLSALLESQSPPGLHSQPGFSPQWAHPQFHPSSLPPPARHPSQIQMGPQGSHAQQGALSQRHPLQQTQQAAIHQRPPQDIFLPNHESRRASIIGTIAPIHPPTHPHIINAQSGSAVPSVNQHPRTVQPSIQFLPSNPHSNDLERSVRASHVQRESPGSDSNKSSWTALHSQVAPAQTIPRLLSSQSIPSPAPRIGSAPMMLDRNCPPNAHIPPSTASTSNNYMQTPSSAPPSFSSYGPPLDSSPAQPMAPTMQPTAAYTLATMTPSDFHLQPQNVAEQGEPTAAHESLHGTTSVDSPTSLYHFLQLFDSTPMMTTVSPRDLQVKSPSPTSSRKRDSICLSDSPVLQGESEKRPRLTSPELETSDYAAPAQTPLVLDPFPPSPLSGTMHDVSMETMQTLDTQDFMSAEILNTENEEVVEVGLDGLRLVTDCLADIFEYNTDGLRICKLCFHRFQQNYISEPPMPFINASDEELESHCLAEHEQAWTMVRQVET